MWSFGNLRPLKTQKLIPLLVIAAGIWAYHNSFQGFFVLDDWWSIIRNPTIRHLWPPWEIIRHTSRPVVQLSVALNFALGGLNPWGYHAFNLGIHILAALILYGVGRRTLLSGPLRTVSADTVSWLAGVVSLIWLVHPLQTESVTYVIQRGELLMGLFYLLSLYCVIRSNGSSRSAWWQAGAVVSCALGVASKPVMVTAPLVIFLYDRAFLAKSWREVMEHRWGLYAGLTTAWLLLLLLLASGSADWKNSAGFAYGVLPPFQYALTQAGVVLHYLRLVVWPHPLCFDYGWNYGWPAARSLRQSMPELIIVGALLTGTIWAWRRKPALGFLGLWFFIILAPTSSFVPVADLVFEHRMYLPLAALIAIVVLGAYEFGKRIFSRQQGRVLGCAAGGLAVVLLTIQTVHRNQDYSSEVTLWQDTVTKCPNNPRAHYNLGVALGRLGKFTEEIGQYEQALRIKPDYADAHYNLGVALGQVGKLQEAIGHFNEALRIEPDFAEAHNNLGVVLIQMGRVQEAIDQWEQALQIQPDNAEAQDNLGNAFAQMGKLDEAIRHYEQAVRLQPDYAIAYYNLGGALARLGRVQEAIERYEQALRIKPDFVEAQDRLARLRARGTSGRR